MKILELSSGLRTVVSNEENMVIELIQQNHGLIHKRQLDERQQQVASDLVKRDVLTRTREQGRICYRLPSDPIWRI